MDFLAEFKFKTAYKSRAQNFAADFFSQYSRQEVALDEAEDNGNL